MQNIFIKLVVKGWILLLKYPTLKSKKPNFRGDLPCKRI